VLRSLLLSLCCLAVAAGGFAQPTRGSGSGPAAWTNLRVPGGVGTLLKAAGLDENIPRSRALREIAHVIYDSPEGTNEASDARRRTFIAYLELISAVEAAGTFTSQPPLTIRQAEDKNARKRLEAIAAAMGCTLERESQVYKLQADQGARQTRLRADLAQAGLDVDHLIEAANAGEPVNRWDRSDEVPLPLAPETWRSFVRPPESLAGSLLTAIVGDRRAALLYHGLLETDASTRGFLQQNVELLRELYSSDRAAVFAGCGGGIRVAGGRMAVPGGPPAEPLWQALVDEPPTRPDRFIPKLLDRDGGRLASLYGTVAALDSKHQAFVLGTAIAPPEFRLARFKRLYDAYGQLLTSWVPAVRPFVRILYDGAHVLALTAVDATGQAAGPAWLELWRKAISSSDVPANPAAELGDPESAGRVDAGWLVQTLADSSHSFAVRRTRVETWLFAQRVFADAPRSSLPDVLVALRGFPRYRVLLWTLERIGVRDPALYAQAARQADRLSRIGDGDRAAAALALFQGSVALVERATTGRVLDTPAASTLLRSLNLIPMADTDEYLNAIGAWMTETMLPAVRARLGLGRESRPVTVEETLLRAIAGRALSLADSPDLGLWIDGLPYTVDIAGAELSRLHAIREKQHGVPLDTGLDLGRAAKALASPGVSLAQLPGLAAELDRTARDVLKVAGPAASWLDANQFDKQLASALDEIGKIKKPTDLRKLERIAVPFLVWADRLQAQAMLSLVYTTALRDPDGTELLDGDPAPRHDWAFSDPEDEVRRTAAWQEPAPERAGGFHLKGSILGADLVFARESLRRVSVDRFPAPPTMSSNDEQAVAEGVALIVPFDQSDADREYLVSAMQRGRQLMDRIGADPSLWPDAADSMRIRGFRRELIPWAIANEPGAVAGLVSLGELVLLGQLPGAPENSPDAWGTSGRAYDGRWGLRYPDHPSFDLLSGRKGSALTAGLAPDLVLSAAELMRARQLPAALTRAVLECAARDVVDDAQLQYFDDWLTFIGQARVVPDRLDEYLASLMSGGPLVPVDK
jgi:hypothetical protein